MSISVMLPADIVYHIAALSADSAVICCIHAASKAYSFLQPRVQEIENERSFLIGSIARCLINSEFHTPSELKKILTVLHKQPLERLRSLYDNPSAIS
jgi:hypothetical protein